jgi:hypothetical protein
MLVLITHNLGTDLDSSRMARGKPSQTFHPRTIPKHHAEHSHTWSERDGKWEAVRVFHGQAKDDE